MTTKLAASPVTRALDLEINGRPAAVTLEVTDGKPVLRLRAKGLRTGWYVNLEYLCEVAGWHPRLKSTDMELMVRPREEVKEGLEGFNWSAKYGKEIIKEK